MADHGPGLILGDGDEELRALLKAAENWPPDLKEKAIATIAHRRDRQRRWWYCNRGRTCDGKPHEGFEYKHARGKQWPPEDNDWLSWFIMSGRGFGKSRTGAEWVRYVTRYVGRIAMVGRRGTDVRLTMVEGESGLIFVCENAGIPYTWRPSTREFIFEETGARVYGFSAEEPDSLRGPQFGAAWWDEPAHADDPVPVWDNLMFGLRLPGLPGGAKVLLTGTPIPSDFVRQRLEDPNNRLTTGSTYENMDNLDPTMARTILEKYEGTHKGRQELYGEVLVEVEGSLWTQDMLHYAGADEGDWETMDRIVVSIDPAGSVNKKSDDTGIIVVGIRNKIGYVLADFTGKHTPESWARIAVQAYENFKADAIVAENNFGGQMVKSNIDHYLNTNSLTARVIVTNASRSKELRAEPIVGLYEQNRIYHIKGLNDLEREMLGWVPGRGKSPNRVDALVHGFTELMRPTRAGGIARVRHDKLVKTSGVPGTKKSFKRGTFA